MSFSDEIYERIGRGSRERFARAHALMSFSEYLEFLRTRPYALTRDIAQYAVDMMEHFGSYEVQGVGGPIRRFRVFDDPLGDGLMKVVGQEVVQNAIYGCLREFVQRRQVDRMILLTGPNGSSKTTIVAGLVRGLEAYSREDAGVLLRFNWIFSEGDEKGGSLGFSSKARVEDVDSFAHLDADQISAKIPCELNENPIFLVPRAEREALLEELIAEAPSAERAKFVRTRFLIEGDLSPKSRRIYDSLIKAYRGDWTKVMRHVQVERFDIHRRYRQGAVSIEPQGNMDAQSRQIGHATMNGLPPVLQNETLFEVAGDLVDANGGIVEYSDFLKRPMEANKYLLTTAENGVINLPSFTAHLNLLLVGTSNENYLAAFRRDPLYSSFKARLELIRVPYLRRFRREEEIYRRQFEKLPPHITVAPHTARVAAIWAVMTRLMEPRTDLRDPNLRRVVERLSPLDKALLYDEGRTPRDATEVEAQLLLEHADRMRQEYDDYQAEFEGLWDAAYEGRRGCSPREMLALLSELAVAPPGDVITPLYFIRSLPALMKDRGQFEFLRLEATKTHYHDTDHFVGLVEDYYDELLANDLREAADLVDEREYDRLLRDYVLHLKASMTDEKVRDAQSGEDLAVDERLLSRVEALGGAGEDSVAFRQGLMAKMAGFRLDFPDRDIVYAEIFPDLAERLQRGLFEEQMSQVVEIVGDCLDADLSQAPARDADRQARAEAFRARLEDKGYGSHARIEALRYFLKRRESGAENSRG
jgi:serine protein kinase